MKILVINGPNLNMLGVRDVAHYGAKTLRDIEVLMQEKSLALGAILEFFQSNHEGFIVDFIQENYTLASGIIINPGALTHYGLSMRDALEDTKLPIVEVHLSDIHSREEFRKISVVEEIGLKQISGIGWNGYIEALEYLVEYFKKG